VLFDALREVARLTRISLGLMAHTAISRVAGYNVNSLMLEYACQLSRTAMGCINENVYSSLAYGCTPVYRCVGLPSASNSKKGLSLLCSSDSLPLIQWTVPPKGGVGEYRQLTPSTEQAYLPAHFDVGKCSDLEFSHVFECMTACHPRDVRHKNGSSFSSSGYCMSEMGPSSDPRDGV
jgi:hypothetical protein